MLEKNYLNLADSYEFNVKVFDHKNIFAGYLKLTPEKCTLRVMGERDPSNNFHSSKIIKCSSLKFNFFLYELSISHMSSQLLQYDDKGGIGFFEYTFNIGFIVCSNQSLSNINNIKELKIQFPLLKSWIGNTTTQNKILDLMESNSKSINSTEFRVNLENYGSIYLAYKMTSSWESLGTSNKIQPYINIIFNEPKNIGLIHEEIEKIYTLLAFYIGYDFDFQLVNLTPHNNFNNTQVSVYHTQNHSSKTLSYMLFPLGHNLKFDPEINPLPLSSFNSFYNLNSTDLSLFHRYIRYDRMKSTEEKFLGFFRLLEKITYQISPYINEKSLNNILERTKPYLHKRLEGKSQDIKAFLKRIPQLNNSKYNTHTCLSKFYDRLPSELTETLCFKKRDLHEICKLRNDVTHANYFIITDKQLFKFTLFIKVLLYLALLEKVGINIQIYWQIATRIEYFRLLQSSEIKIT